MDSVKAFNAELTALYEQKPPISKAKMTSITRGAIKAMKFYKHVVQSVEKFIQKCKPEYKVPGLYVIDSIVRQSRHQFGAEKDVFAPRFAKNMQNTFIYLFRCPPEEKSKVIRVLNLWQKNSVFQSEIIQPLFDLTDPNHPIHKEHAAAMAAAANSNGGLASLLSLSVPIVKTPPSSRTPTKTPADSSQSGWQSEIDLASSTILQLSGGQTMSNLTVKQLQVSGQLAAGQTVDPNIIQQLQKIQQMLIKQQQDNAAQQEADQVKFDKKLLDFDYGSDDDDDNTVAPSPKPHPPASGLENILSNPEVMRQLHNLQQHMSQQQHVQQAEMEEKMRKLQEMKQQEEEFDKHLAMAVPNLPFASECDLKPPPENAPPTHRYDSQFDQHKPVYTFPMMDITQPPPGYPPTLPPQPAANQETVEQGDSEVEFVENRVENDTIEIINLLERSRSRSPANLRHKRRRSRSRSRDYRRGRRSRSRSISHGGRSTSRTKRRRSRSRDRDREKEQEKEKDREKERERKKKGLPPIKAEHLSVCSTTLWVGHLSKLVQQEDLSDTFGEYGDIVSIDLIPPRGCAFICMNRRQDANRALTKLKNFKLQGKAITLAWAPGKGVKGKEWKDYWEVELGVSYIPWAKLSRDASDLDVVEEGGVVDEDTVPDYLKAAQAAYRAQQPMPTGSGDDNLMAPGFIPLPEGLPVPTSVGSVDTSQPPPSGGGLLPPPGSMGPMVPPFGMGNVSRLLPPMGMPMGPGMMGNVPMGVPPPGMQGLLMPPGGQMMHQQMMPPPGNPPFGMMNHHGPLSQIPLPGPVAPQDKPNTGLPHNAPPMGVPPPTSEASLPGLSEAMLRVPFGAPPPFISQHNDDSMEMEMEEEQLKTNKGFPAQIRLSDQLMAAIRGQGPFSHQMSMPPPPLQMPTLDQPPKDNREKDKEGGDAQGRREGRRDRDDRVPNDRDRDRDRGRDRDRDRDRNRWSDRDRDRDRRDRDRDREPRDREPRDRENRDRDSRGGRSVSQNNEDQTSKGEPWNNNQESENKPTEKLSLSERLRILAEGGTLSSRDENKPDSRKDNRNENRDAKSENRTDNRNENRKENRNENRNDRSENRNDDRKDSRNEGRNDNRGNRNPFGGRDSRGGRRDRSESSERSKERDSSTPKNTGSQNAPPSLLDLPKMSLPEGLSQASTDRNPPLSSPGGSRPMFPRVQAGGGAPLLHGPGPEGFRVPGGDGFGNFRPVGPGEAMRPPFGPHGGPPEGMLSTPLLDRRPHDREGFDPRSHPRDIFDSEEFDLPPRRPEFDARPDEFPPREFGPRGPPMGDEFGPPRGPPMGDDFGPRGPPMGEEFGPPRGPPMGDDFGPPRGPPRGDEFDILPLRPEDFDPRGPHPEDFDPRGPPRFDPRGPPRDGFPHPDGFDPRGSRPDFDPRGHPDFFPPHGPDGFGPRGMMGPPRRMGPDGFGPRPMMRGPGPMFPHGPPGMPSPGPRPGMWMDNQGPPMFPPRGFEGQPGEEEFFGRAPPPFDEMDHRSRDGPRGNWEPRGLPLRRGPAFRDAPRRPGRGGPDEEKEDDEIPSKADRRRSRWSNASPMAEDAPPEESVPPTERSESVPPLVEQSVLPSKESTEANPTTERRSPPSQRVSAPVEESRPIVEESLPIVEESLSLSEEKQHLVEESRSFTDECMPFAEESQPFVEESQSFVEESQSFVEERQGFVEENRHLVEESQPFIEESQPFIEESQPFIEESRPFLEESQPFIEESLPFVEESARLEQESEVMETSAGDSTPCNDEPRESEPIVASAETTEAITEDLE